MIVAAAAALAGWPAGAAATLSWPAGFQVTSAAVVQTGGFDATLNSTACWSAGSCVSVGEDDVSGAERPIVVTDSYGVAAQAVGVTVPAGALPGLNAVASLNGVSCSSAGACVAVGDYEDTSGNIDGLLVPITAGRIGKASEVTVPGASGQTYLRDVSCPLVGSCVAVGTYESNGSRNGIVVTITNGAASAINTARLPANGNTTAPLVSINAVSCWAAGYCVAAGQYLASSNAQIYPFVIPISNGVPAAGNEVTLPTDAVTVSGGQQAVLNSVSCQATGVCVAAGDYVNSSGGSRPLVVPVTTAGKPRVVSTITLPADARAGSSDDGLDAVSCGPTGACKAVGDYIDASGSSEPLAVSISAGAVGATSELALPSNALALSTGTQAASLLAVACPQSGSCLAVGDYNDSSGNQQGLIEPIPGGASVSDEAALPAGLVSNPDAILDAVACTTSASCLAVGSYGDAVAQPQALEYSLQAGLAIATAKLPKAYIGTTYTQTLTATGAWKSYTWSIASGRLPAGLKLNAKTGKISGNPRTASTRKLKVRVAGTGSPAQNVTRALSIRVVSDPAFSFSIPRGGLKLSGKSVSVRVRCAKTGPCRGSLTFVYAREVQLTQRKGRRQNTVIGRLSYSLGTGRSRTLKVKLTTTGLSYLEFADHQTLSITVDATVRGGRSSSRQTTLRMAASAKRKKK